MAKEIKKIPVADQAEAAAIINGLSRQYDMKQDTSRFQLQVANDRYAAYYDKEEGVVRLEAIHPETTEEEIREFLINFPPFF
ncbi:MAG: hypothetical protein P4L51_10110 [Puia sp.]|nr:hypothetical protein [Puia sp.]